MGLEEKIRQDLKEAMKGQDNPKRNIIRLVLAGVKNAEIERRGPLADPDILEVISREVKRHRESIEAFTKGNRPDLVAQEEAELKVLLGYLPQQLSREDIVAAARRAIAEVNAQGPQHKGKVMAQLMPQLKGKAQGQEVNEVVTELLAQLGK